MIADNRTWKPSLAASITDLFESDDVFREKEDKWVDIPDKFFCTEANLVKNQPLVHGV